MSIGISLGGVYALKRHFKLQFTILPYKAASTSLYLGLSFTGAEIFLSLILVSW